MSEFDGNVVLVTGAAGALGAAVVDYFANAGAVVVQFDVVEINNGHPARICDLTDPDACSSGCGFRDCGIRRHSRPRQHRRRVRHGRTRTRDQHGNLGLSSWA